MEKTEEQIKRELIARRGSRKATLTRIKNKMDASYINDKQMLQLMVERAQVAFNEYEDLSLQIGDEEDPVPIETTYYECVAAMRQRISDLSGPGPTSGAGALPAASPQVASKVKLPNIQIPTFAGKYTDYRPFIEMFTALVHNNEGFDCIQKFFYLRSFLKAEAFDLVKNLPVIGQSYSEALKILADRYDNKYKIINEHINALFELPVLTKSSPSALRSLISITKQHLAALKNLDEAIEKWDSILICLLNKKLDPLTNREYFLHRDSTKQPTFNDFLKFVEGRALALENSEGRGDTASCAASKVAPVKVTSSSFVTTKASQGCLYCVPVVAA
ncbi:uncharacterized protein LOC133532666 [Cydia pomonella]|uniref:uncharacterized protein LOC133532666 n=1 Tax=Cydia pomonella TaxID=82600 RepID=UPI002ADDE162|nr:uncharacterized protein LOC133532666 [Cydia pomonella]